MASRASLHFFANNIPVSRQLLVYTNVKDSILNLLPPTFMMQHRCQSSLCWERKEASSLDVEASVCWWASVKNLHGWKVLVYLSEVIKFPVLFWRLWQSSKIKLSAWYSDLEIYCGQKTVTTSHKAEYFKPWHGSGIGKTWRVNIKRKPGRTAGSFAKHRVSHSSLLNFLKVRRCCCQCIYFLHGHKMTKIYNPLVRSMCHTIDKKMTLPRNEILACCFLRC